MANDRLQFAIGRLENAVSRVERLTNGNRRPAPAATTSDPELIEQHEQLRQQVRSAIGRIDALLKTADH